MFDKITIIGCGLIGSSLMRVIDKKKLSKKISLFDKSKEVSTFIKNNFSVQVFNNISVILTFYWQNKAVSMILNADITNTYMYKTRYNYDRDNK